MTDHNSDREAFQPVGEGALVSDPALDHPADGQPSRQREASHSVGIRTEQPTQTDPVSPVAHRSRRRNENAGSVSNTNSTPPQRRMLRVPSNHSVWCDPLPRRIRDVLWCCHERGSCSDTSYVRSRRADRRLYAHLRSRRRARTPANRALAYAPRCCRGDLNSWRSVANSDP